MVKIMTQFEVMSDLKLNAKLLKCKNENRRMLSGSGMFVSECLKI